MREHATAAKAIALLAFLLSCHGQFADRDASPDGDVDADADADSDADTSGDLPDEWIAQLERITASLCTCFGVELGFEDQAACFLAYEWADRASTCFRMTYVAHEAGLEEAYRCRLGAFRWEADCHAEVGCDWDAAGACEDQGATRFDACPEPAPGIQESFNTDYNSCIIGSDSGCPDDATNPSTLGASVFTGSTEAAGDDFTASCGTCDDSFCFGPAADRAMLWTAPTAGDYRVDTLGSAMFDTILTVLDDCTGEELACNDDVDTSGEEYLSAVNVSLTHGQTVVIVVDGFSAEGFGNFVVNISRLGG